MVVLTLMVSITDHKIGIHNKFKKTKGDFIGLMSINNDSPTYLSKAKAYLKRYESFDSGNGKKFEEGKLKLEDLYAYAKSNGKLKLKSGKQELIENILFNYIK